MKKKDVCLLALLLAVAAVMALFIKLRGGYTGERIVVTIDGAFFGEYRLSEDRTIDVEGDFGQNRIVIQNGSAYMEAADCPDKYCMAYRQLSKTNESIICLPHRLVVQVKDAEYTEIDGIAR